ncbi:MAG: hypothetical protein QXS29_10070 [Nitrososphaeria archaeon]
MEVTLWKDILFYSFIQEHKLLTRHSWKDIKHYFKTVKESLEASLSEEELQALGEIVSKQLEKFLSPLQ